MEEEEDEDEEEEKRRLMPENEDCWLGVRRREEEMISEADGVVEEGLFLWVFSVLLVNVESNVDECGNRGYERRT